MPNGRCQRCPAGQYLIVPPTKQTNCKECPLTGEVECLGGSTFYPAAGHWRASEQSEEVYQCRFARACLGKNGSAENVVGVCAHAYQGILCA